MGKYAESTGVWEHTIAGITHRLTPRMGDNERIAKIVSSYQLDKDVSKLLKNINSVYYEMLTREDSSLTDEDKTELKVWIELNQAQVMEEIMVAFRWTSKEEVKKHKQTTEETIKNSLAQSN